MRFTVLFVAYTSGPALQPCRVDFNPAWRVSEGSTRLASAACDVTQVRSTGMKALRGKLLALLGAGMVFQVGGCSITDLLSGLGG